MSQRDLRSGATGSGLVPLRMRRQFPSISTTQPPAAAPVKKVEKTPEDSDDDCCIIIPDPPKIKKSPVIEIPDVEASSSGASYEYEKTRNYKDNSDSPSRNPKTFQMRNSTESLTQRIRKNLECLRQGREMTPDQAAHEVEDDFESMSVAQLMKKAKEMSTLSKENKDLKSQLTSAESQLKTIKGDLTQKEGVLSQYESEIETMSELLRDAEGELDKAHKDRMTKGNSSEEVNKLTKQLRSQKEAQEMQDRVMSELQQKLKASQSEVKLLKSEVSKLTTLNNRDEKELAKKSQEMERLKNSLKEAEAALSEQKGETKKAKDEEQKVKSEMIYKSSLLTMKSEKQQKEEREKLKKAELLRKKSLDVTNMCYSTIGALAKELNQCKGISESLSDLLQEMQIKLVERQVTQIKEGEGNTSIKMDENLKEILKKTWDIQKRFRPVILIDIKDDNIGNVRSQASEIPSSTSQDNNRGHSRGRGRGRGRGRRNGNSQSPTEIDFPSAPAITNIPANFKEFDDKVQENNRLLLSCLDQLAAAHNSVTLKDTELAGMSEELCNIRKDLQAKEDCYTIHVYERGKDKRVADSDTDEDDNDGAPYADDDDDDDQPYERVVTSVSAIPQPIDESPEKERPPSANITVVTAEEAEGGESNIPVWLECESDGEMTEGSRTLATQTTPVKDHILVLVDSDDERPIVVHDSDDESADTRTVGIGATTSAKLVTIDNAKPADDNQSSPVKAGILTNVTTISQSLFEKFPIPSDAIVTRSFEDLKTTVTVDENEADMATGDSADAITPASDSTDQTPPGGDDSTNTDNEANKPKFILSDFAHMENCTEEDRVQALKLILGIEAKEVDFKQGPPLKEYTYRQISMVGEMLRRQRCNTLPRTEPKDVDTNAEMPGGSEENSEKVDNIWMGWTLPGKTEFKTDEVPAEMSQEEVAPSGGARDESANNDTADTLTFMRSIVEDRLFDFDDVVDDGAQKRKHWSGAADDEVETGEGKRQKLAE